MDQQRGESNIRFSRKMGGEAHIAVRLRQGKATAALWRRRLKLGSRSPNPDEWRVLPGPGLPALPIVDVESRQEELTLVCRVPEPVLSRTVACGHTEWNSALVRLDMKPATFCGIRYVDLKVRHTIGAFVSLASVAPIFSVGQVALICLAKDFNYFIMAVLIVYVCLVELCVIALAESRSFGYMFSVWQVRVPMDGPPPMDGRPD
eukprot:Protomagalhaensia_sp_Gyna_25__5388@NODE_695_length_2823_cov_1374_900503_g543_i0_p2_GENE_NODE_695_length_2823_cov_1374_900503_g543_i0NODE_695_length_2823_cov_1374_900503_g543_i0_p2_ORF_typecomplete_len205_score31_33_NODE_695_length_2823_cov_1374_900503_g543_i010101624